VFNIIYFTTITALVVSRSTKTISLTSAHVFVWSLRWAWPALIKMTLLWLFIYCFIS